MPRPQWKREYALLQEAYTAGTLTAALVERELVRAGVQPALFSLLGWVAQLQPVAPSLLSAETGVPPTTLRDYIRRLTDRGLVRRRPNPEDGRSYHIVLTATGERLIDRGVPALARAYERLAKELPRSAARHLQFAEELRLALRRVLEEEDSLGGAAVIGVPRAIHERR